jgi:predicted metal-binding membrane protein
MTPAARERMQVRVPLLFVSAGAWLLLLVQPENASLSAHCAAATRWLSVSPSSLALGWALMLAAMMLPLVIAPARHIRARSFPRRRARALVLFLSGYAVIWMLAGAILLAAGLAVRLAAPESLLPAVLVAVVALVWQCSPVKQRCLNRCHSHAELAAFGAAADRDSLRFGLTHGLWCAGSCWALMLLPVLLSRGHLAVMASVSLLLFAERLDRPMPPAWRVRLPHKALRIMIAQACMRLQRGRYRAAPNET